MIWQVRCVTARRVMQRSGRFGWGLAGAVRCGKLRHVQMGSGEVR